MMVCVDFQNSLTHKANNMPHSLSIASVAAILVLALLPAALADGHAAQKPMNVLLIVIDDLRPELNAYGKREVKTPNIDRLSSKGIRFNRAYCQYPVCNPSRASFLSGKRPDQLGILSNKESLREEWPDLVTLPQLFRNNGYFTSGIGKLFHVGLDEKGDKVFFREDVSFEHSYFALHNAPKIGRQGIGRKLGDGSIVWAHWLEAEGGDEAQPDGMLAAEAVRVLKEQRDKPFFISVGFHKPHDPFIAPKEYFKHYPIEDVQLADEPADRSPLSKHALNPEAFASFKERDHREFKRAYHACTTFADAQVGKLLSTLDELKLWENTIVILLGDHGYHLGEHSWWNKVTVFELGARGPMIMWVPGSQGMGQPTDSIVEFVDLYPTLVDLCGLKAPHELAGKSLRPILESPAKLWDNVAYTQVTRGPKMMGYSVRTHRWRYIRWGVNAEGGEELYDHSKDSGEYYNLAESSEHRETKASMHQYLKAGFPELNK